MILSEARKKISSKSTLQFFLAFAAGILTRLGLLILAIVLARTLGPEQYGTFTFAVGAAMVSATTFNLGLPNLFNRLYPLFIQKKSWGNLKGMYNTFSRVAVVSLFISACLLILLSQTQDKLQHGLSLAAIMVIPLGLTILRKQQLMALKKSAIGLFFDQGFAAFFVIFFVIFLIPEVTADIAIKLYAVGLFVGVAITTLIVRQLLPKQIQNIKSISEPKTWLQQSIPLCVGTLSKTLIYRADILMLAPLTSLYEIGIYSAAFRLTYALSFPQVILMTIVTPLLSEALASKKNERLKKIMHFSTAYAFLTAVPILLIITLFPTKVIDFAYGDQYLEASKTLIILSVSQLFMCFTNASAALLMMGGKAKQFSAINLAALIVNLSLNALLIPNYGAVGAAYAALGSGLLLFIGQTYFSLRFQRSL